MNQNIDLDKLEKKVWKSYFQDGMFDIFFATMFITIGIINIFYFELSSLLILVSVGIFIAGKQFITKPRLGTVKFSQKRMEKQQKAHYALLATFLATLVIFVLSAWGQFNLELNFSIMFMILFIVIFGSLAYFLDFYRFLIYGLMFAIGEYTNHNYGDLEFAWVMLASGSILLVMGFFYLTKFIKDNPLPQLEVTNAQENNST